jgi:hypothetical protein
LLGTEVQSLGIPPNLKGFGPEIEYRKMKQTKQQKKDHLNANLSSTRYILSHLFHKTFSDIY